MNLKILLIFHGSRHEAFKKAIAEIVEDVKKRTNYPVEAITLSEIDLSKIEEVVGEAERVIAVPVFLSRGIHTEIDIPKILGKFKNVEYAGPLSPDPRISEIILDKVRESINKHSKPDWNYKSPGISDHLFLKSKGGLTREEIRSIIISKAKLKGGENVLDIGTGSASVAIEFALFGCSAVAVEKNPFNFEVAKQNIQRFGLEDKVKLIKGDIANIELSQFFDVVFIGGADNLKASLDSSLPRLKKGGRIIIAAVRLETMWSAWSELMERKIQPEILSIWMSKGKKLGHGTILTPSSPVFLIYGEKK
ncbi:MAG: precorrin-6Y C5,15-methyltransferase (decarboxylating) subunit CbiT [Methanocellales archaeon]